MGGGRTYAGGVGVRWLCAAGIAAGAGAEIAKEVVVGSVPILRGSSYTSRSRLEDGRGGYCSRGGEGFGTTACDGDVRVSGVRWGDKSRTGVTLFERDLSVIGVGIDIGGFVRFCGSGEYCGCWEGNNENRRGALGRIGVETTILGFCRTRPESSIAGAMGPSVCGKFNIGRGDKHEGERAKELSVRGETTDISMYDSHSDGIFNRNPR